jgi:hypothetical protein
MRLLLLPLALLLLPAPVQASNGPATVRVTGRAGEVAHVALPSGAALGNAGSDTAISAPGAGWAGVVMRREDRTDLPPTYYRVELYEPLLCPGRHCEPPSYFHPTGGSDDGKGHVVLTPGTYAVTLLGEPGTRVSVTIAVRGGHGTVSLTTKPQRGYAATAFVPTADAAVHGFATLQVSHEARALQIAVVAAVVSPVGSYTHEACVTSGGEESFDSEPGGTTPCYDFSGEDTLQYGGGPLVNVGGSYVAMPWMSAEGRAFNEERLGVGVDATASGAFARVVGVGVMLLS